MCEHEKVGADLSRLLLILGVEEVRQMTADLASKLETFRSSSCTDNEADESNHDDTLGTQHSFDEDIAVTKVSNISEYRQDVDDVAATPKFAPVEDDINNMNLAERFKALKQCKLCYKECPTEAILKRHEEEVHKDDQEELQLSCITLRDLVHPCADCPGVRFLTKKILNVHTMIQHSKDERGNKYIECNLCCFKFRYNLYPRHIKAIHKDHSEYLNRKIEEHEKIFPCRYPNCDLRFVTEVSEDYHYNKTHLTIDPEAKSIVECSLCYYKFTKNLYLKGHITTFHQNDSKFLDRKIEDSEKVYSCNNADCTLRFVNQRSKNYHYQRVHLQAKKFNTSKVWAKSKKQSNLHEEQVECKLCYLEMKKSCLKIHEKIHILDEEKKYLASGEGELNISCDKCQRLFLTEESLIIHHQMVHLEYKRIKRNSKSQIKNLKCLFCDEKMSTDFDRISHCFTVHGKKDEVVGADEEKIKCTVCSEIVPREKFKKHKKNHKYRVSHKSDFTLFLLISRVLEHIQRNF